MFYTGHVDSDEILIKNVFIANKKETLFIVTHVLKREFFNEGTISRIKHSENLENQ